MLRRFLAVMLPAFCLFALVAEAWPQQYPSRTVTIIVPYPAGGPTDETARVVANFLSKKLGQNFIASPARARSSPPIV
jgi:tripartite-type tricarboxylate transporter receptor subunit TctC